MVASLVRNQQAFFQSGATRSLEFRRHQLECLRQAIGAREDLILEALAADLGKPKLEAASNETIHCLQEIDYALKHLATWLKPQRASTPLPLLPATSEIVREPLGVALIISPWNYPFQLAVAPLVGAIAAGNCAILKPSELAPHTANALATLVAETFEPDYITVTCGDKEVAQALLVERFDSIFFTGSPRIGQIVMAAAAKHLTPVVLELGGKSPCIVDRDVPIDVSARRIAWGKFLNAGQSCIAPDYLLVHQDIFEPLLAGIEAVLQEFYGDDPAASPNYARIISAERCRHLQGLIAGHVPALGGDCDPERRYFAPTILTDATWADPIMAEEIFGPILPVLTFVDLEDAIAQINARPKPLALYVFSRDAARQQQAIAHVSAGTACINDTMLQYISSELPFGGVGNSGMGAYHGRASFEAFSHRKSVVRKPFWLDVSLRYPPYAGKLPLLRRLLLQSLRE